MDEHATRLSASKKNSGDGDAFGSAGRLPPPGESVVDPPELGEESGVEGEVRVPGLGIYGC